MLRLARIGCLIAISMIAGGAVAIGATDAERKNRLQEVQVPEASRMALEAISEDLEAGRYEPALAAISKLPQEVVETPLILNARGAALVQLGRYEEAQRDFEAILEKQPKFFPARFNQGEILFLSGNYAEAATYYRLMMVDFGASSLLKFKLYLCYLLAGQDDRATGQLRAILYPVDGVAWYYAHAAAALHAGDEPQAERLMAAGEAIHTDNARSFAEALRDARLLD